MQKARVKGKSKIGDTGLGFTGGEFILEADSIELIEDEPKEELKPFVPKFADVARRGGDIFFAKTDYDHANWPAGLKPALNLIELFDEMEKAEKKYETERFDEGINAGESRIFAQISNNTGNTLVRIQWPHHEEIDISLSKLDFRRFCMQGLGLTKEAKK